MTAFIPGQAVEQITPTRHVRGTVYSIDGLDQVVMRIEEIVRGSFLHIENAANLRAYVEMDELKAIHSARIAELEAEVARLREALTPFRTIADEEIRDIEADTTKLPVCIGYVRSARAALQPQPTKPGA